LLPTPDCDVRHLLLFCSLIPAIACAAAPPATVAPVPAVTPAPAPAAADVGFMRNMIVHHRQALTMSELAPSRTSLMPILLLAERIAVSQRDEIDLMQTWLRNTTTDERSDHHHAHSHTAHDSMPGMASEAELDRLRDARGPDFDRLFLELMIRHHEGALVMVEELLQTPGAGQRSDVYRIASEIDADQRAEIVRMRALLNGLPAS
jgi:uncharacterized protein (DUF305 family)